MAAASECEDGAYVVITELYPTAADDTVAPRPPSTRSSGATPATGRIIASDSEVKRLLVDELQTAVQVGASGPSMCWGHGDACGANQPGAGRDPMPGDPTAH